MIKRGRFYDDWKGGGYFVSIIKPTWHALIALRPRFRFAFVRPDGKPSYRRLYVGPLELEWSRA